MTLGVLLWLGGAGLLVGFVSGLAGIGGGVLIVPLLYFFYGHAAWSGVALPGELHAVVAHATSLFVIVPTSAVGTFSYQRAGAVSWSAALPVAVTAVLAALLGTWIAPALPAEALKLGFGVLVLVAGVQLLRKKPPGEEAPGPPSPFLGAAAGAVVGLLSALLGVGGGIIVIPILIHLLRVPMAKVAATSLAVILFTALAGVVGYAVAGAGEPRLPAGSLGYVHALAGLPIAAGAIAAVSLGARLNLRMKTGTLRVAFALLFMVLGLRLIVTNAGALPWPV